MVTHWSQVHFSPQTNHKPFVGFCGDFESVSGEFRPVCHSMRGAFVGFCGEFEAVSGEFRPVCRSMRGAFVGILW